MFLLLLLLFLLLWLHLLYLLNLFNLIGCFALALSSLIPSIFGPFCLFVCLLVCFCFLLVCLFGLVFASLFVWLVYLFILEEGEGGNMFSLWLPKVVLLVADRCKRARFRSSCIAHANC